MLFGRKELRRHVQLVHRWLQARQLVSQVGFLIIVSLVSSFAIPYVDNVAHICGLIAGILMIQFIGFPLTWLFGMLGDRISPLLGIFVAIVVYTAVTFYAVVMTNVAEFYIMSAAIGCVQGAIQAMSRSYYGRLIPADRASEFFGFYNMMGKFASVLGPFLMAATAAITGNSRSAILSVAILFVAGAILLAFQTRSTRVARGVAQEPA